MPHGVEVTEIESCTPQELGVPAGRFTFLCMFDFDSVVARKNPIAAVEAFRRAFQRGDAASLLIKTTGAERHRADYDALASAITGIPNVHLVDAMPSRGRVNGLTATS